MGRFSKEVDEFVAAFKAGNDIGYRMRYFQLQQRQQQLREMQFQQRLQRGTGAGSGMPADTQDLINQGRDKRFGPGSENTTTPPPAKQATVQPKKQEIPDATPTTQPDKSSDATPAPATPSSGGGGSTGEKHASILDRYPGSYQTAALEAGTMNDASPVRSALGGVSAPGGATPKLARFDASKAPAYLDGIAQKYGIDPTDFKRMAWIESKFDPNARAGSSSAGGLFQFTDGTAKTYGLTNKFDGVANAEAAARLWNDNKAGLTQALGRAPTAGELYLAHQQGLGGAKALLSNPNASAASAVGRAAVVNNGGRSDMSAREFANMWTGRFDNVGHEAGTSPKTAGATTTPSGNEARNTHQQTAVDVGSVSDANNDIRRTGGVQPANGTPAATTTPSATPAPTTPTSAPATPTSSAVPTPPQRPDDLNPEFPKTTSQPAPEPPRRPEMGPPAPEAVPASAQPGQEAIAPAAQQPAQDDGWSFLDDIGQGIDDFFNDLSVPADWDVGSGGDVGGIGDALGGIGDAIGGAIGGLFSNGGMVR